MILNFHHYFCIRSSLWGIRLEIIVTRQIIQQGEIICQYLGDRCDKTDHPTRRNHLPIPWRSDHTARRNHLPIPWRSLWYRSYSKEKSFANTLEIIVTRQIIQQGEIICQYIGDHCDKTDHPTMYYERDHRRWGGPTIFITRTAWEALLLWRTECVIWSYPQ